MKKFLIKSTAGLFALSLLVAPMMVFAATAVQPPSDCTVRSDVETDELESLTGNDSIPKLPGGTTISPTTIVPALSGSTSVQQDAIKDNFAIICVFSLVSWVSNLIFLAIGTLAVLVIALSALFFVTAAGSEDRLKKAKAYLLYGAVGIGVAALANLIPAIVKGFFGAG